MSYDISQNTSSLCCVLKGHGWFPYLPYYKLHHVGSVIVQPFLKTRYVAGKIVLNRDDWLRPVPWRIVYR